MAELRITISDDKVTLILNAYAAEKGIAATAAALKAEIISEIKQTVKSYLIKEAAKTIADVELT